jgi:hypothetical protein
MAESLGSNADLTTAFTKWKAGEGVSISSNVRDTNSVMRANLQHSGAYNTTNPDFTTLLSLFLKTRSAP